MVTGHLRGRAILGIAAALVVGGGWATWTATARPQIVVATSSVDFGPIAERRTMQVEVRNTGRAPLQVLAVTSSCGCTTPAIGATTLAPRATTHLAITFDPVAHGPQAGPATHAVYVRTNDPRTPEVEIAVTAVVLKGVAR
jgi:hypothetical protein